MEDVRLGRQQLVIARQVVADVAEQELVPFNDRRVSLTISAGTANIIYGLTLGPGNGSNGILGSRQDAGPFTLNIRDHGALVFGPFYVSAAGPCLVYGTETILPKE